MEGQIHQTEIPKKKRKENEETNDAQTHIRLLQNALLPDAQCHWTL